jgi:hypothetical protein
MEQADRGQELEGQIMALVARLADTAEGSATEAFIVRQLHGLRCDPRIIPRRTMTHQAKHRRNANTPRITSLNGKAPDADASLGRSICPNRTL